MSIWILPAVILFGVLCIVGFAYWITKDLDADGEPQEWME